MLRRIALYPRTIEAAAVAHEPHRIAFYLYELASEFHAQWTRGKDLPHLRFIIQNDRETTAARLALVEGIVTILASGLALLGVECAGRNAINLVRGNLRLARIASDQTSATRASSVTGDRMADDQSQRPYRASEPPVRSAAKPSGNDPLAELARLIGQTDPFAEFGRESARRASTPQPGERSDWDTQPLGSPFTSQAGAASRAPAAPQKLGGNGYFPARPEPAEQPIGARRITRARTMAASPTQARHCRTPTRTIRPSRMRTATLPTRSVTSRTATSTARTNSSTRNITRTCRPRAGAWASWRLPAYSPWP